MTEKLYNKDAYLKTASAEILDIRSDMVILDKTVFAPDAGGQPCDPGKLIDKCTNLQ